MNWETIVSSAMVGLAIYLGLRELAGAIREAGVIRALREVRESSHVEAVEKKQQEAVKRKTQWASPKATGMAVVPESTEHNISAVVESAEAPKGADTLRRMRGGDKDATVRSSSHNGYVPMQEKTPGKPVGDEGDPLQPR